MKARHLTALSVLVASLVLPGCHKDNGDKEALIALLLAMPRPGDYDWSAILPAGWPTPTVPAENPMSNEKVRLGRYLFYDKRLSGNMTQACATCHIQAYAFSDTRQTGLGSTGQSHPRSPQHLSNVAYFTRYTWANNAVELLEEQAKAPLYGTVPVELGQTDPSLGEPEMIARLKAATDVDYSGMFASAFGGNGLTQITELNVRRAIASFERTMISGNSYFDQYERTGSTSVFTSAGLSSAAAIAGAGIFNDEAGDCFHCHGGFAYIDQSTHTGTTDVSRPYHANGIHTLTFYGSDAANHTSLPNSANVVYPNGGAAYQGLYGATLVTADKGLFRAPSLRNAGVTHPFMHDGSFRATTGTVGGINCASGYIQPATNTPTAVSVACVRQALKAVIHNYTQAGQALSAGAPGDASTSVLVSSIPDLPNGNLTTTAGGEEEQLAEFLMSLTDPEFLTRESLSNPACGNSNFVSCP